MGAKDIIIKSNILDILNNDELDSRVISLVGILEGYLSKISKGYLTSIGKFIDEITLYQLGLFYKSNLINDDGRNGVCWEYTVFNSIQLNNDYVQTKLNESINYLTGETNFDKIEAILWGGEKTNILATVKSIIEDNEMICTPYNQYNFKDSIDLIYNCFHKKNLRQLLPNDLSGIWKTDLFVKKQSSNRWYAVTVKWNYNDIEQYNGLSIAMYYEPTRNLKKFINPRPIKDTISNKNYFVYCGVPYNHECDFGGYYVRSFKLFEEILSKINCDKMSESKITKDFPYPIDNFIFDFFYKHRYEPCKEVIEQMKFYFHNNQSNLLGYNEKPIFYKPLPISEIILATNRDTSKLQVPIYIDNESDVEAAIKMFVV